MKEYVKVRHRPFEGFLFDDFKRALTFDTSTEGHFVIGTSKQDTLVCQYGLWIYPRNRADLCSFIKAEKDGLSGKDCQHPQTWEATVFDCQGI